MEAQACGLMVVNLCDLRFNNFSTVKPFAAQIEVKILKKM